jgi:hypothetical protein
MRMANEILKKEKTIILIPSEVIEEYEDTLEELKKRLLQNSFE